MIAIVDYGASNLHSVARGLRYLGVRHCPTAEPDRLLGADAVILPGVGSAGYAMKGLMESRVIEVLGKVQRPLLGICLGLQLLFESTAEDDQDCLGLLGGRVTRFSAPNLKVPHVGWNQIACRAVQGSELLDGIPDNSYFYFVHSYFVPLTPEVTIASTRYGPVDFAAAVHAENYWGVQFHPELSGRHGLQLLENFVRISKCW